MNNKLCLIDGDGLLYHSSKETLQESILILDEKINNIFEKTEATHYVIFISNTPYFRHKISSDYKSGRSKYTSPLKWLKTLKKYLVEGWSAQSMNLVEADDLCAYWYNQDLVYSNLYANSEEMGINMRNTGFVQKLEELEKTVCSPDKDLLGSIPGTLFNYTYKLKDKDDISSIIKGWWVRTPKEDAYINFWKSMVCGDITDGIKGIEGSGEVAFNKMLKASQEELVPIDHMIFEAYRKKYGVSQGIFEFQKNYRLLHLLDTDEDFIREVGVLPTFPEIKQVPTKPTEEVNLEELKF